MTSGQGDVRIILLGKTGAGKSATGNTILGRNAFKETSEICEKQKGFVDGKNIVVFDTPGLFNASITKEQVKAEIERCVEMSAPGPHVFLLVIKLGVRFTQEERNSVQWIQENFGKEALLRTIILFTHTDLLRGKSLEAYIRESCCLPKIVDSCGGRYHSFNNEDKNNQHQIIELLQKINALRRANGMRHYTPEVFRTIQQNKTTEITGNGGMTLPNVTHIFSVIIVIGVIFLGAQQWNNMLQKEEEILKNDILQMEKEVQQVRNKLSQKAEDEKDLKSKIEQNEQEENQLRNELSQKIEDEKVLKNKIQENEQMENQLRNELSRKVEDETDLKNQVQEKEQEQLKNELLLKEWETQLKNELKKVQVEKQMRNELPQKEQEEVWLKNEIQSEEEQLQLEEKLQQKEQKHQLNKQLQQKEQEELQLKKELLQKEQEKHQLKKKLIDKEQEELELKKELLQIKQEKHKIIKELKQKEKEKDNLKKELQKNEQENQELKKDLQQKQQEKQQMEKKLLQYKTKVQ